MDARCGCTAVSMDARVAAGFVVVAHDMRGHGLSGYMDGLHMSWPDFKLHCRDLVKVLDSAQARHPGGRLPLCSLRAWEVR